MKSDWATLGQDCLKAFKQRVWHNCRFILLALGWQDDWWCLWFLSWGALDLYWACQTWIQIQVNAGSAAEETLQATEWDKRMRKYYWTIMIISLIKNLDFCLCRCRWKFALKQSNFHFLCLASTGSCPALFTVCAIRGFIRTCIMYCVSALIHKKNTEKEVIRGS